VWNATGNRPLNTAFRSRTFYLKQKLYIKTSRFTDSQVIAILEQAEAGSPVLELCREHGISNTTFYKWRAKYGGIATARSRRGLDVAAANGADHLLLLDDALARSVHSIAPNGVDHIVEVAFGENIALDLELLTLGLECGVCDA
jgi:putative transposase